MPLQFRVGLLPCLLIMFAMVSSRTTSLKVGDMRQLVSATLPRSRYIDIQVLDEGIDIMTQ